jgi:ABC-type dipeptide/oligopeptide/nickel transport system ATPase subunit
MHYISAEELTKSYGINPLFSNISFHINEGDKIALIARNGVGKSTLLRILNGQEKPDSGKLFIHKDVTVALFEQDPRFDETKTVLENIFDTNHPVLNVIREYELAAESEDGEKLRGKFGFNWTDENIEDNVLTFYTESGHFDMDKGTGYTLTRSSAEGYEEWCASVVSDIEDIDEEIDKTLERYFDDIFEKDDDGEYISKYANQFICLNRFDQLKSKNTYIDWNIGDNVIVNITKSDIKDKIPENMTKIMEQRITKVIKDAIISENNSFLHNPENDFYIIKPPSDSEIDRIIQQISVKTKISGSYVYKLKVMITLIDSTMEADEKAKSLEILNESLKTIYVEEINEIIDNYVRKAKGTTNESRSFSDFFFRYYS